MTINMLNILMP